jgi:hypothetical protein
MRVWSIVILAALPFGIADAVMTGKGHAEGRVERVALKAGESIDLMPVYWVANCKSIMLGIPEIEVLEGPPQVTLSIKEETVLPRRQGCVNRVPGGVLVATAKDIKESLDSKITFRLKYKTRDGERPRAYVYRLSLFP